MTDATGRARTVLVLGGGSEIGLAITRALVERGARGVVLAARRPEALDAPAEALRSAGANVEVIPFDAEQIDAQESVIIDAFDRARARTGDVDIAIVAFGRLDERDVLQETPAEAGHIAALNYAGAVASALAIAQQMVAQGHGTLIVLSSVAGQHARPSMAPYAGAKAGLDAFTDALRDALRGTGVRVMTVRPGWVYSRMTVGQRSMPFAVMPERVAADVLSGLDGGATVVWTPRIVRYVALALRWLPRWATRLGFRVTSMRRPRNR